MTELTINGVNYPVDVAQDAPLLWVLRDELGLTGSKYGCGMGLCGACTVYVDGEPTRSCLVPAQSLAGRKITTIEGLNSSVGKKVQETWNELNVVQCGYCQSGQIMAATALLESNPKPSDKDIDAAMSGNICRCGTYHRIRAAIHATARKLG